MSGLGDALSATEVVAQVDRILSSPELGRSERLKKFLSYTVSETLAGRDDRLKEYTIAIEAFDRDESFDPQTSNIVRVEAGRLRRRLEAYYNGSGRYDAIRIDLPKGGYIPRITTLAGDDRDDSDPTPSADEPLDGSAETDSLLEAPYGPSIAVLPFNNLSGDAAQEFFADGVTEEIITDLTRFRDLFVIARNTTFQYKGTAVDVRALGTELGVEYVLEGSVRKAGDRVRVTAQLIDAPSGAHIWADTFDRTLSAQNMLDVQVEVSQQIVSRIAQPYGEIHRVGNKDALGKSTNSLDVYEAVLRFYSYLAMPSQSGYARMRETLERAVELDPNYSSAWAALAGVYVDEVRMRFGSRPESESLDLALDAANRAVQLDPSNAMAYQNLFIVRFYRHEMENFRAAGERALTTNPNHADMLADLGIYLSFAGDWERGVALTRKAMALSPVHPGWFHMAVVLDHFRKGEYEAALPDVRQLGTSEFFMTHVLTAMVHGQLNHEAEARAAVDQLLEVYPAFPGDAREVFRKRNFSEDLVEHCIDGLRKAGLDIPDQ